MAIYSGVYCLKGNLLSGLLFWTSLLSGVPGESEHYTHYTSHTSKTHPERLTRTGAPYVSYVPLGML